MAMTYYPYFTNKNLKGILRASLNSSYFLFKETPALPSSFEDDEGLYFSYQFGSMIITSVLNQWPKSLLPKDMVSSFHLFQNPSNVVLTFSTTLEVFTPLAKGRHYLCRVQCRACERHCFGS